MISRIKFVSYLIIRQTPYLCLSTVTCCHPLVSKYSLQLSVISYRIIFPSLVFNLTLPILVLPFLSSPNYYNTRLTLLDVI